MQLNRIFLLTFISVSTFLMQTSAKALENADVKKFVSSYTEAWNTHDASLLANYFAEDADMIVGSGPLVTGRSEIEKSWDAYFKAIDINRIGSFEIASAREVAEGVFLLNVISITYGTTSDGEELPLRKARGTWVVIGNNTSWEIAAFRAQPTQGEERYNPGVD